MRDGETVSERHKNMWISKAGYPPFAGDQKFSKFPTIFIDPEVAFEVRHLWEWKILSSAKGCDGWLKPKSERCSVFCLRATNLPTFENQFLIGENYETDSMLISDRQALWKHISMSAYLTFCQYSFKASSPSYWILPRRGETILESILCAAFYISCEKPIPSLLPIQYLSALFHLGNFLRKSSFINCTSTFRPEKVNPAKYRRLGSVGKSILLPFTWYWMRNFIEFSCLWIFAEKEKLNQSFEKVLMQKPDSRRAQNSGQIFWEKIIWWNFRGEREGHWASEWPLKGESSL